MVANWREKTATSLSLMRPDKPGMLISRAVRLRFAGVDGDGREAHLSQLAGDDVDALGLERAR